MARLAAHGKYLLDGAEKFYLRGVSYGPFAANSRGERYPEPERAAADFALMSRLGANLIRLYVPPPPWMVEEAQKAGLRMMLGIPWPFHMAFLDSRDMMREIRDAIRQTVLKTRQFGETIAAYSIGNEIRSDIVRWHGPRAVSRFLAELRDLGKQIDPGALFTYSNYPSAEYLDLSFLDFISFNVYLHREEDFRRYLTHLMGQTGELPLVLSETGMDTIREGEQHQAELLSWQCRAAFELGLSGFIVFAFTDEWHTGGAEITDWAFGLTRRDRSLKLAFDAVAKVFGDNLPPPLAAAPKATVVVAAYNAASTLGECLSSIRELNYPDYETIVIDDGSTDSTSEIASRSGVRAIRVEHNGLAAARNAGVGAASGEVVAFIDADARADRDWLYHLVETIERRDAAAAAGPNFAPAPGSARAAAMAAAPGLPREVRAGDDRLAQLCGCNMAITKAALLKAGGFDPMFTTAGDDVDLSWRLAASAETLAYAPGAIVIHERRATLAAYLRQQRGYGAGEGLLLRKYPLRIADQDGIYAGPSWIGSMFGGARVYYGAFGRGLFQTVYSTGNSYADLPLTIQWVGLSLIFLILGVVNRLLGVLGAGGIALSMLAAAVGAASAPLPHAHRGPAARIYLWIVNLLGPAVRSLARERVKWRFEPAPTGGDYNGPLKLNGQVEFVMPGGAGRIDSATILVAIREGIGSPRRRSGRDRRLPVLRPRDRRRADDSRADKRVAPERRQHRAALASAIGAAPGADRRGDRAAGFVGRGILSACGHRRRNMRRNRSWTVSDKSRAAYSRDLQSLRGRGSGSAWNINGKALGKRNVMRTLELYGHVIRRMRPHLGRLAIAIGGVLLASATEVLKPWPLKIVIDNVLRGAPMVSKWIPPMPRGELLAAACVSLVILYALLGLLNVMTNYVTVSIGQRMVNELRARLFDHLQRLSLSFHRRREVGDLMVRITYDTYSIQTIAMNGFFPVLSSLILLGGMFVVMIRMDATLTLVALAIVPLLIALIMSISGRIDAIAGGARIKESRLFTVAQSALAAIHVVQAFTREGESYREFVESSSESLDATLRLYTLQTIYAGAVGVLIACGTATVIYLGAQHVLDGRLTIGDLIVFTTYLASLYAPVNQISQTYGQIEGAKAGLRRCLELLAIDPEIKDRAGAQTLGRARGEIEFDNVVFGYEPGRNRAQGDQLQGCAGRDHRDRRSERLRKNHDGQPARALLRTTTGRDQD